jgi:outer membrane receptor protein involved in Fe transport
MAVLFYRLSFIFLFLLFSVSKLWAIELGSIRGRVMDKGTGGGIVGAKVMVKTKDKVIFETITDDEGTFAIEAVPNGTYDVEARISPYIGQKYVGVQVKSGVRPIYFRLTYNTDPNDKNSKERIELIYTYASLAEKERRTVRLATGEGDSKLDIPATGYLISNEDINDRGYTNLLDVLKDIPEIQIQEKIEPQTYNYVTTRGIVGSGALLIMQNGVRINSMTASDFVIAQNIPIRHVSSIEIVIGPASALYGADCYAGVVNIITLKGNQIKGANIYSGSGMYNTTDNIGFAGFGNEKRWVSVMASYYRSDNNFYQKAYPQEWDWYTNNFEPNGQMIAGNQRDTIVPFAGQSRAFDMHQEDMAFQIQGGYKKVEASIGYQSHQNSTAQGYNPKYSAPLSDRVYKTSLSNANVKYTLAASSKWDVVFLVHGQFWEIAPKSYFNNSFARPGYKYGYELGGGSRITANYKINPKNRISFGFAIQQSRTLAKTSNLPHVWQRGQSVVEQDQYYTGSDAVDWQGNSLKIPQVLFYENRAVRGQFFQYQGDLHPKITALGGFRIDIFKIKYIAQQNTESTESEEIDLVRSLRLGLVYKPNPNIRAKIFFSQGFLTPASQVALEHFGSFAPRKDSSGRVVGLTAPFFRMPLDRGEDLQEQKSNNLEGSFIYTNGNIVIRANGFYNLLSNIPAFETQTSNSTFQTGLPTIDSMQIPLAREERLAVAYNARLFGGTTQVEYKLITGRSSDMELQLSAAYSYISGIYTGVNENISHLSVRRIPDYTAAHNIKAGVEFKYKLFSTYLNFAYFSPTANNNLVTNTIIYSPDYWVVNLFAKYDLFASGKSGINGSVFIKIQNLTDNRYYHMGRLNLGYLNNVPQQPLTISGGIVVGFTK